MDTPALLGGAPAIAGDTYPSWPQWGAREREELLGTLDSGAWWTGDGDRAFEFATAFAAYQDAAAGLPFTNGTHTLEAALVACGVGEGDEVIVPGMTFVASATAVLSVNAIPVLVDVDPDTLCIDPEAAEAAITDKTRAIIAVHVAGAVSDLDLLVPLCVRKGLHLIEDCAHAHGSQWRGRGVGSYGSFGSFSMQQSKLITAGEGGALIGNDERLLETAWNYADCGRARDRWFYHHATIGSNFRMSEWQGAVLLGQLERFPAQHAKRNENAIALGAALAEIPGLRPQKRDPRDGQPGQLLLRLPLRRCAVRGHAVAEVRGGACRRRRADGGQLPVAVRSRALPHPQLRPDAPLLGARARLLEPAPSGLGAPRGVHGVDPAPHPAGRAGGCPARARGARSHPGECHGDLPAELGRGARVTRTGAADPVTAALFPLRIENGGANELLAGLPALRAVRSRGAPRARRCEPCLRACRHQR